MNVTEPVLKAKEPTAKKSVSLLTSLVVTAGIVILIIAGVEFFSRTTLARGVFPLQSVGSYHAQFEIKWFKLAKYVEENDGVDVILLGNSMVNTGIDPTVLSEEYEALTGDSLRVFNFGVEGLTVAPNSFLAKLLVEIYHPKALIYFTEMRDYVAANGVQEEQEFLSSDWLNWMLGANNLKGWLISQSSALQTFLPFRGWMRPDFLDTYILNVRRTELTQPDGYEPETRVRQDIDVRPDPSSEADKAFFELYGNYQIDESRLSDLDSILTLNDSTTTILISEIPAYFTFFDYFGGESIHQDYLHTMEEHVRNTGGVWISPIDTDLIPLDGRADRLHLNTLGAEVYSKLFAARLSELCAQELVCLGVKP